jgi:hypothetical protein
VLLIMDASGSMNAKLPNGETRIAVAQRAVKGALPPGDYIVEVDGNKFPFPATEGEVLELKPQ